MDIWGLIIGILSAAVVIWIVGRLGLGLEVEGFVGAIVAAIVIGIVAWLVSWLLGVLGITLTGGFWGALILLVIAAIVLLIAARFLPGLTVNGFVGAIIAAIAIGVVAWVLTWLLGLLGIG